jgi:hypothetical protein
MPTFDAWRKQRAAAGGGAKTEADYPISMQDGKFTVPHNGVMVAFPSRENAAKAIEFWLSQEP